MQLEREAAAVLGATGSGGAEAAELRREAGRLAARGAEAGRAQERLSCDLARAVERREAILIRVSCMSSLRAGRKAWCQRWLGSVQERLLCELARAVNAPGKTILSTPC